MMAKLSLGYTQLLVQKLSILKNTQFEPTRWISPDSGFCFPKQNFDLSLEDISQLNGYGINPKYTCSYIVAIQKISQ